jgi:hypothetical protein
MRSAGNIAIQLGIRTPCQLYYVSALDVCQYWLASVNLIRVSGLTLAAYVVTKLVNIANLYRVTVANRMLHSSSSLLIVS